MTTNCGRWHLSWLVKHRAQSSCSSSKIVLVRVEFAATATPLYFFFFCFLFCSSSMLWPTAPVEQHTERVENAHSIVDAVKVVTPRITLERLTECELALDGLREHARFPQTHQEMELTEVAFEMITDDMNQTLQQLDSIRARKSKFVCVNDDMRDPSPELVQALADFYESFFPTPSQFELPPGASRKDCVCAVVACACHACSTEHVCVAGADEQVLRTRCSSFVHFEPFDAASSLCARLLWWVLF